FRSLIIRQNFPHYHRENNAKIKLRRLLMKRKLALALGLAVISSSAFATKARLQALGEDVYGSKYISDNRNIFINAAYINLYKDQITYEYGDTTSARDQRFGAS